MKATLNGVSFLVLLFSLFLMFMSGYILGSGQVKESVYLKKMLTSTQADDIIIYNPPTCRVK